MDPGGTLRPGGADGVAWRAVPVPFVGRERELLISPGEGEAAGVHIDTINTWKTINANQAAARWGASTSNPGGVGPLGRNMWVHRHASLRLVIPPDVGKIDVGYASDTSWSLTVAPI
ncbi:hypothetical protein BJF85_16785 [Saccharomonospora sp. CUA-673]|nr:hypothetical protein BJF85_16785 [Saccharomonospora sp. CUA-673]